MVSCCNREGTFSILLRKGRVLSRWYRSAKMCRPDEVGRLVGLQEGLEGQHMQAARPAQPLPACITQCLVARHLDLIMAESIE